ncbi:transporter [Rubritalea tangerina]|uniref:Transporter n=1 Tax=Rubritalea tangerina TaxID=430798 RepID=A0ABW4ZDA4_9BACT
MRILIAILLFTLPLCAQELTPRRWSHLPTDKNLMGLGYAYTQADIFLDPVLQVENLELELQTLALRYIRTFEFLGTSSRFELGQGYQDGIYRGLLRGEQASAYRSGPTDTLLRISSILYGAPPLKGKEFAQYRKSVQNSETLIGAALILQLPTGDYSENQLINIGSNRFTIRPQIGIVHQRDKWTFETSASMWAFSDNNEFWQGTHRQQDPLWAFQSHLIYTFQPGFWSSASIGYGIGAENEVNGINKNDSAENLAFSLAGGYAFTRNFGAKIAYIGTRTQTDKSFDSDTLALGFSWIW